MANVLCEGKDSNGKPAPIGATTDSSGDPAIKAVTDTERAGDYETQEEPITPANDFDTDIATSRIKKTPSSGYNRLIINFKDAGSAAINIIYVVLNADDDADAVTKLGTAGARIPIAIGDEYEQLFQQASLVTRIDFYTPDTETGAALVTFTGRMS